MKPSRLFQDRQVTSSPGTDLLSYQSSLKTNSVKQASIFERIISRQEIAAKLFVILALAAVAHCSVVSVAQTNADYTSFAYNVADPYTGDYKSQVETRVGGNVQGHYSLLDADGTKRTVDYAADDFNGFNAVVRKDPAVISTPVVAAAPTVAAVAARTVAGPAVVASSPSVVAAHAYSAPAVVASAPAVVAARAYAAPAVVASAPAVVARKSVVPAIYSAGHSVVAPTPISYSVSLNYW